MSQPPFDPDAPGSGDLGLFGLPHGPDDARAHVIAVPFEATASGGKGTAGGPAAILAASRDVDLHDLDTGGAWKRGIWLRPTPPHITRLNAEAVAAAGPVIDAGGPGDDPTLQAACQTVNAAGTALNAWVRAQTHAVFEAGKIPAIVGGDHSVPFGAIAAAVARHPGLGILHIDAHADLRDAYMGFTWSHASIFRNLLDRLDTLGPVVQVGLRDVAVREQAFAETEPRITWFTDPSLAASLSEGIPWAQLCHRIVAPLPRKVWVSLDIDGLEPALCPNTGTPVPGGLGWRDVCALLRVLAAGRQIVGFDLCEVSGEPWDANVGARMLYTLVARALRSQGL